MGLFKNRSNRTNSAQRDAALRPILLRTGAPLAGAKTLEALSDFGFDQVTDSLEFHEIYAKKGEFEYTFSFIEDAGKTHLTVLAYSETAPLKIKKNLKEIMLFLRERLSSWIV